MHFYDSFVCKSNDRVPYILKIDKGSTTIKIVIFSFNTN